LVNVDRSLHPLRSIQHVPLGVFFSLISLNWACKTINHCFDSFWLVAFICSILRISTSLDADVPAVVCIEPGISIYLWVQNNQIIRYSVLVEAGVHHESEGRVLIRLATSMQDYMNFTSSTILNAREWVKHVSVLI